jgi:hypothetical protein
VTPFQDLRGNRFGVDCGTLAEIDGPQFTYAELNPSNHRSGFAVLTFFNGQLLWRINYGPKDYVGRRGGDLIIEVDPSNANVKQVLRGQ